MVKAVDGVYDRWTSTCNNIVSYGGMQKTINFKKNIKSIWQLKSREARAGVFDHLDAANLYPTSPFKGRNIVDFSRFPV